MLHRGKRRAFALVGAAVAASLAWRRWRPFAVAVEGESMAPTLRPGELLLALGGRRPVAGSIVVVEHPRRPGYEMVKRVAEERAEGLWVLGDDPARSTDSRQLGALAEDDVRGVVTIRYWPLGRWRCFGCGPPRRG